MLGLFYTLYFLPLLLHHNRDVDISGEHLLTTVSGVSLYECMRRCNRRVSCSSMSYRRRVAYCKLYDTADTRTVAGHGTVYARRSAWNQIPQIEQCDVTCPPSQTCENSECKYTECQGPPSINHADIRGNQKSVGAIVKYTCQDDSDMTSQSTCMRTGQWSEAQIACVIEGFRTIHLNHFAVVGHYVSILGQQSSNAFHRITRDSCIYKCRKETIYCEHVSYFSGNGTCVLSNRLTIVTPAPGWEIIEKIFPVTFHFETASEGVAAFCSSKGASRTSYAGVEKAYYMGYNVPYCGHISDHVIVSCLHNSYANTSDGVRVCKRSGGTFCDNPLYGTTPAI